METLRVWILTLLIVVAGCNESQKNSLSTDDNSDVTVKGVIEDGEYQLLTIDRMGPNAFIPVDSVRCDKEGRFEISFPCQSMDFFALKYSNSGYITLVAYSGDSIEIMGTAKSLHPYNVKGSPDSYLIQQLSLVHKKVLDDLQLISKETNEIQGHANYTILKQNLNRRFDSITNIFHLYSTDFIRQHSSSPAILIALYNQYGPRLPVFELPADLDTYQFIDSSLYKLFPENEAVKSLHSHLSTALYQIDLQKKKSLLSTGMEAPDFVMKTDEGELLALTDLRGKYVLLQFWASWSKLSMDENIYLKNCFEKYKSSNFTILQVSIDNDKQRWLETIEKLELNWLHVSDLNRWETAAADMYDVERIPANFLVNPKGVIVEKDLFGDKIEGIIGKYVK